MGACCGCLNGGDQPSPNNYEPINNQREVPTAQVKSTTKVSSINYYQTIVDDATSNFINSKPTTINSSTTNHEDIELLRTKFGNTAVNPVILKSPPIGTKAVPGNSVKTTLEEKSGGGSSRTQLFASTADELGRIVATRKSSSDSKASAIAQFSAVDSPSTDSK